MNVFWKMKLFLQSNPPTTGWGTQAQTSGHQSKIPLLFPSPHPTPPAASEGLTHGGGERYGGRRRPVFPGGRSDSQKACGEGSDSCLGHAQNTGRVSDGKPGGKKLRFGISTCVNKEKIPACGDRLVHMSTVRKRKAGRCS